MKFIAFTLLLVFACTAFIGCATFNKIVTNDALISQLAVEAATARVIHEHPTWKNQTIAITGAAISAIDAKTTVSLKDVETFVNAHIAWSKLLPEEQAIISTLISQVRMNLEDSFAAQGIEAPTEQLIGIRQLLEWINETAKRQA